MFALLQKLSASLLRNNYLVCPLYITSLFDFKDITPLIIEIAFFQSVAKNITE